MATPADMRKLSFTCRDAKGNVVRMTMRIGGASGTAIETAYATLQTDLQAVSNAHISQSTLAAADNTYGTSAEYNSVEDKAVLVFQDENGSFHRFQVPAPKSAGFEADQESVNPAETNMAALIAAMAANVYGFRTATAPLSFIGGNRTRRRLHRKANIWTKSSNLDEPGD